jgi:hypothetical protein
VGYAVMDFGAACYERTSKGIHKEHIINANTNYITLISSQSVFDE